MKKEKQFASILATNGISQGYTLRSHKQTRPRLKLAITLLIAGVTAAAVVGYVH